MAFDITAARKGGATDSQIAEFLSQNVTVDGKRFDLVSARKEASDAQIAEFLAAKGSREVQSSPAALLGETTLTEQPAELPFKIAPEDIGGAIGGGLGFAIGGPVGGVAGAGLGGATVEAGQQLLQQATGSPKAPQTSREAAKEIGIAGGVQAGYELIGHGAAKVMQKVARPFGKFITKETRRLMDTFAEFGGTFTPAQATENALLDQLENIASGSLFGAQPYHKFKEVQGKIIDDMVKTLRSSLGTTLEPNDIGQVFLDVLDENSKIFKTQAEVLYGRVDELLGQELVSNKPLKNFAKEAAAIAEKRAGIGASSAGDSLLIKVGKLPEQVTFKEAAAIRSGLLDEKSTLAITKDKAVGLASEMINLSDNAMEKAATNLSNEALSAWRDANSFWKSGKETYRNIFIRKLASKDAELIGKSVFANGKVTTIRRVKKVLGTNTEIFKAMRAGWLEDALIKASDEDGRIIGKSFLGRLKQMGEPTLREMWSKSELEAIENTARIALKAQRKPQGGGEVLVKLVQGSAIVSILVGKLEKTAGAILIGPGALSHLITKPTTAKWLREGFSIPASSAQAVALGERLIKAALEGPRSDDVAIVQGEPLEASPKPAGVSAR